MNQKIKVYWVVCFFLTNFSKKKLSHIGHNGISEFIMAINKSCKNPINGIMLPFNLKEVFFVNIQQIFRKFSELSVKPIIKCLGKKN